MYKQYRSMKFSIQKAPIVVSVLISYPVDMAFVESSMVIKAGMIPTVSELVDRVIGSDIRSYRINNQGLVELFPDLFNEKVINEDESVEESSGESGKKEVCSE